MCTRPRLVWNQKSLMLSAFSPKIALMAIPVSSSSILCHPVRYTPYRPLGSIDHVPRRPLETRMRLRERLRCMLPCGGTACLQIVEATGYAYYYGVPYYCARGLMPCPSSHLFLHPLLCYTLYAMTPVAGYACERLLVAAKRMRNTSVH